MAFFFRRQVMNLVELTPLAQALVGLPGQSGLSVEQRKRLTIAVELVANPAVVFMDEPTSGAASRSCLVHCLGPAAALRWLQIWCKVHLPLLSQQSRYWGQGIEELQSRRW